MKLVKKIEIKLTVKDNQFLKEQVPYLQRCCKFTIVDEAHEWCNEQTDLIALIDSDEFIIALDPVKHRYGELTIDDGEIQYIAHLEFKGTSMTGNLYGVYEPYVLLTPSEALKLIFPDAYDVGYLVNVILNMVFGLKNEKEFKYEII